MPGAIAPVAAQQFFGQNGLPLVGGLLYFWAAGSLTLQDTFADVNLVTKNANPLTLDAEGRVPVPVFWQPLAYKVGLTDANNIPIPPYPVDGLSAFNINSSATGERQFFGGDASSPVTGTSYPSGATFDKCHAGTTFYSADSAIFSGQFKIQAMIMAPTGDTVSVAIVNLTDGAPDTPIAEAAGNSMTGLLYTSGLITWPAPGSTKTYGIKVKTLSGGPGYVWGVRLIQA